MKLDINRTARLMRKSFKEQMPKDEKIIDINYSLPYVGINLVDEDYFFQGSEAEELLQQAKITSDKFATNIENTLLWMAQGW